MDAERLRLMLEILASLSTALGIPLAIVLFYREKKKERRELEFAVYDAPHREYLEYLRLCLEYPELDAAEDSLKEIPTPLERKTTTLFTILISMLERAFLLYGVHRIEEQWRGWDAYIDDWCAQERFRQAWRRLGGQFDERFVEYVNTKLPVELRVG